MAALSSDHQSDASFRWALGELCSTELGDGRRTKRLVRLVSALAANPTRTLPEACEGWAETKGAYRLLENEELSPEMLLSGHRRSTLRRIGEQEVVLLIQDTTGVNFTKHRATQGLGPMGGLQAPEHPAMGFFVHSCIAVTPQGLMLGVLSQKCWVRPQADGNADGGQAAGVAKESERWKETLQECAQALPAGVKAVTVCDREADIFDFLFTAVRLGQHALVRARHNRVLPHHQRLWVKMDQAPVVGSMVIEVPRSDDRPARTATLELRVTPVRLQSGPVVERLPLTAVLAREIDPPAGVQPVEWRLLTTLPVTSAEAAATCVNWYAKRWIIERFHYTLKSGCQVEQLQLETVERLQRAVAVYSIVAWRLMYLTYLARVEPDAPCTEVLTDAEWKALYCVTHKTKQTPPDPPDVQNAIQWIARLGGFLGRKRDGRPGLKVLWRGLRRLEDITFLWTIMQ